MFFLSNWIFALFKQIARNSIFKDKSQQKEKLSNFAHMKNTGRDFHVCGTEGQTC